MEQKQQRILYIKNTQLNIRSLRALSQYDVENIDRIKVLIYNFIYTKIEKKFIK